MGDAIMGRNTDYTVELGDKICQRLSDGESLRSICRDDDMPYVGTVLRWVAKDEVFRQQYARAMEMRADTVFEGMIDLVDECEPESGATAKARLQIDARKWVLARMNPKKYGEKLTQELTGANGSAIAMQHTIATPEQLAEAIKAAKEEF